jgi:hypothetical protein
MEDCRRLAGMSMSPSYKKKTGITSPSSMEPFLDVQISRKAHRIPVPQAVSIQYDCELGEHLRETNPAFWSVGNVATTKKKSTMMLHGLLECDNSVV